MNADQYQVYLAGDHWRAVREWALRNRGHRCEACGSAHALHVHHRSYDRLGAEHLEDLRVLCDSCHELVHDTQHQRQVALGNATDIVTATADPRVIALAAADEPVRMIDVMAGWLNQVGVKLDNHQAENTSNEC